MSGMYNVIFGNTGFRPVAAKILGTDDFGRYRDSWVEMRDGKPVIAIYTRNGGGNRECWNDNATDCKCTGCFMTMAVHKHPLYLFDRDDDFDSTYATIYYRVPDEYADDLAKIALDKPVNMSERWLAMIESLKGGAA